MVGSSLGGFYALAVAEHFGCKALLVIPAINSARDLARDVGEHSGFHDPQQRVVVRHEQMGELPAMGQSSA